jgi:hypothetical protein
VQPARTVYTGNYAFRPEELRWFIPYAPLRLRMSGPTMGRLLQAEIGPRFVSANLPMLHKRTLEATGQSEFRPGVEEMVESPIIDLCGEFERQFHGDVMLFSMQRLTAPGYPGRPLDAEIVDQTLCAMQVEMRDKYRVRQQTILQRLAVLKTVLRDPANWWRQRPELVAGRTEHAFGVVLNYRIQRFRAARILAQHHAGRVRVRTNPEVLRESRLFGSTWGYVRRNSLSMVRIYTTYRPLRVFSILAAILAVGGLAAWSPFLFDWIVRGDRSGRLQSVILGAVLIIASLQVFALGVIADLIATQRTLAQRTLERVRGIELRVGVPPAHYEPGQPGSLNEPVEGLDVHSGERT